MGLAEIPPSAGLYPRASLRSAHRHIDEMRAFRLLV